MIRVWVHSGWKPWAILAVLVVSGLLLSGLIYTSTTRKGNPAPAITVLASLVEDVAGADGHRYQARDDRGNPMDGLKVIDKPGGGYLGVYHAADRGVFSVKVATSATALDWTHQADLDTHASQPTIAALSDGGFLVAEEADSNGLARPPATWLRFRYYGGLEKLLSGEAAHTYDAPHTLAPPRSGAEGTPTIYSASLAPDLSHSKIEVGFHYFKGSAVDRQAAGVLENFASWSSWTEPRVDSAIEALGAKGHIGDRDAMLFDNGRFSLHEGQLVKGLSSSWRIYLFEWSAGRAVPLAVRSHKGSQAFANPTFTRLRAPSGRRGIVVTMFIPGEEAAPGEAGELIYFREDPAA